MSIQFIVVHMVVLQVLVIHVQDIEEVQNTVYVQMLTIKIAVIINMIQVVSTNIQQVVKQEIQHHIHVVKIQHQIIVVKQHQH